MPAKLINNLKTILKNKILPCYIYSLFIFNVPTCILFTCADEHFVLLTLKCLHISFSRALFMSNP